MDYQKPPLKKNQAIISTDTELGIRDYFLVEIKETHYPKKKTVKISHIEYDLWIDYIKDRLIVDKSNRTMTAFCLPGRSLREQWDQIPQHEKLAV